MKVPAGITFAVLAVAAGCGGSDTCSDFSGSYSITTEIVATDCRLGLHAISQPVTWTFVQTAPSCSFTMTNSLYPASQYVGQFTMEGKKARVTWTSVDPAPSVGGSALSYTSESLTIAPGSLLWGRFEWSSASPCSGTTNVCHGTVPEGCLTPN
jgi:hypothetical protein